MKKIRILHTGGTITMQMHDNKDIAKSNRSSFNLDFFNEQIPGLRDIADVVIISQALYDEVDLDKYEGGRQAKELGAISGGDMTTEACVTKLMYLLAYYDDTPTIKERFRENIAGERTV